MGELRREWGKSILRYRKALGLNQQQFAEALGVTQATVSRWEKGYIAPTDRHKVQIATLCGADVRTMFPLVRGSL